MFHSFRAGNALEARFLVAGLRGGPGRERRAPLCTGLLAPTFLSHLWQNITERLCIVNRSHAIDNCSWTDNAPSSLICVVNGLTVKISES